MAPQTPYIGSKISLISKLDIRYEGILYAVDSVEATIALTKVKSFGTEDRPTPHPVSGRDEIYEYIIFKASDIKDLIVCEPPKQSIGGLPYDPAIVMVSQKPAAPKMHSLNDHVQAIMSSTNNVSPPATFQLQAPRRGLTARARMPSNDGFLPAQSRNRSGFIPQYSSQENRVGFQQGSFYNNRQSQNADGTRQQSAIGDSKSHRKLQFDSDYDFEKANESFKVNDDDQHDESLHVDKVLLAKHEPHVENTADNNEKFYNKSTSFFDCISCESMEKQDGKGSRPDWNKERMTNQETFGAAAVRAIGYRRGGYRGMRGAQRYNNGYSSPYIGRSMYIRRNNV